MTTGGTVMQFLFIDSVKMKVSDWCFWIAILCICLLFLFLGRGRMHISCVCVAVFYSTHPKLFECLAGLVTSHSCNVEVSSNIGTVTW